MREIKFRAWWKLPGLELGGIMRDQDSLRIYSICALSEPPDNLVFMQYTGLKDKNGKEIYEGDIVKYDDVCSDAHILNTGERTAGVITWIHDRAQLMPQDIKRNHKGGHYIAHWDFILDIEVIGNKWENPELLETPHA